MSPDGPPFRCLHCGAGGLKADAAALVCSSCGATYPMVKGVPLLVRDWEAHRQEIEQARAVNAAWYETEQPAEDASPWRHHLRKRRLYVTDLIERHLRTLGRPRVPRLLDIGCGDGNHLAWLAPFAERIYGSDYNILRLARSRARLPTATLFMGDILDFPVVDGAFDIIFFNHVIEHIPDDRRALSTIARILAPGGLVILGTPNEGAWWWQLAYRRAPEIKATTDHVHFYTAETIAEKMTGAGLSVVEVEHMGWGPPDWRLDGRIRKYKLVDDAFELVGRTFMKRQASSLYLTAKRSNDGLEAR